MKLNLKSENNLSIKWSQICAVLIAVIILMLAIWQPWNTTSKSTRKITVTGEATLKASPDEYVLYPYFEYTNADRTKANADLTAQANAITAKLKELGVTDEQIKSTTSGYDKYGYMMSPDTNSNTLTLSYTITTSDKDIAQKVQDYMLSVKAKGQISPQANFSQAKQKELQAQAREKAIADAKAKADTTAKQFNAKVGKVVTINDGYTMGGPMPVATMDAKLEAGSTASSLPVQTGQNDYSYSISVEYELK